jgi:hypothetical protein
MLIDFYYIYVSQDKPNDGTIPGSYYKWFTERFRKTYVEFKPDIPHKLIVISGGATPDNYIHGLFDGIASEYKTSLYPGWDIGAYQEFGKQSKANMVICCGSTTYFWKKGWMERFVDVYNKYGPGLYGPMASYQNNPHLRGNFFSFHPVMMKYYPNLIDNREKTFLFESGNLKWNFCRWAISESLPVKMVTWESEYDMPDWRKPDNIFRRGDQSNCMVWDRHTDIYFCSAYNERLKLSADADGVK